MVYGGSLGGAVAIDLASRRPHRALVVVSAFSSIRDMARERHPLVPSVFIRTRSFIDVACGSLSVNESNSVSLSCASTYVMISTGESAYPAG